MFKERVSKFSLPEGFDVVIEPWPYGGMDLPGELRRYFQGLVFAIDTRTGNPDSNYYSYPLPIIPVMDFEKQQIVRIDELATGGGGDSLLAGSPRTGSVISHCTPAEYVPELLPGGTRKDLKPLSVVQPDGPSFSVKDESLIEWQKWRFRVSFNPREGAVIHDVQYDGRSILYRLSISEMVCICSIPAAIRRKMGPANKRATGRPYHTPIPGPPSIGSRLLTLVMAVSDTR